MTGAALDTRRRALGLSIVELGRICAHNGRPVAERTVHRWLDGYSPVPDYALEALDAVEEIMERAVDRLAAIATEMTISGPIQVRRYRTQDDLTGSPDDIGIPLGAHAMMTAWLDDQLAAQGIDTEIVWADVVD